MNVDGELIAFFIRGDRELNETKVQKLLGCNEINFANDELIKTSNAVAGYTGPMGLNTKIIVDREVTKMKNFVCGANEEGFHFINCNPSDINADFIADIVNVEEGDVCPICGKPLKFTKGVEVGNTFKLGTKYAEALNLTYLDQNNKPLPVWMGSYGIGIGRSIATIVEQHHDDKGIIWPESIAPYKVAIVPISTKDETQMAEANRIYDALNAKGVDVLMDDRNERPGVKFNDMELIGIPYRITVGRKAKEGLFEFKKRDEEEAKELTFEEIINLF